MTPELEQLEASMLSAIRPVCPTAKIERLAVNASCGCYSDYTTDPPSVYVEIQAKELPVSHTKAMRLRDKIEVLLRPVIGAAYTWSWCKGCSPTDEDDYDEAPLPSVTLTALPLEEHP